MAGFNPFKKFRVYQKYALAALGIMAMISFVILPSYFMLQRGGPGGHEALIATCRRAGYGNVDQYLLQNLRQNYQTLGSFYNLVARELSTAAQSEQELYTRFGSLLQIQMQHQRGIPDDALVTNWLLTRYAEEKGIAIPNELISERLRNLTDGAITNQMLDSICQQLGLTGDQLSYLLREEMLADYLVSSFRLSTVATSPLSQWEYFQRVRRSLTTEVATIPVESFIKEVKDPSESQLKAFFEENKSRVYDPTLVESGFAIPTKVAFQVIDTEPTEQLLASITQEEIEKYYEENKATMFLKPTARPQGDAAPTQPGGLPNFGSGMGSPLFPTVPGGRPGGLLPGVESLPGPGLNTLPGSSPTGLNLDLGEPELAPLEFPAPVQEPAEEPKQEKQEQPEQPAPPQPTEPQSRLIGPSVYRTVTYRQDEQPAPTETPAPAETPAPTETPVPAEKVEEAPAVVEAPAVEETPVPAEKVEEAPAGKVDEAPAVEKTPDVPFDPNILYQPLLEVENTIRRILAGQKADAAVKEIEKKMRDYFKAHILSRDAAPIDLAALAAEYHLNMITVGDTISYFDAQQHDCWRNVAYRPFLEKIFNETSTPYDVVLGQQVSPLFPSGGPVESIGWVTKVEPQRVPEWTDEGITDQVRERWLTVQARELAEKHAQELSEIANQSKDKPLSESLAGQGVNIVETSPFTWFTQSVAQFGRSRSQLLFGEVCERGVPNGTADYANRYIKAPGADFMETAYSLEIGESGVAMNQPQMLAFVIRLADSTPKDEELWRFFVTTPPNVYLQAGKPEVQNEIMQQWVAEIEKNVGFKWVNRPQAFPERGED